MISNYLQGCKRRKRANVTAPLDEPSTSSPSLNEDEELFVPSCAQEEVTTPEVIGTILIWNQKLSNFFKLPAVPYCVNEEQNLDLDVNFSSLRSKLEIEEVMMINHYDDHFLLRFHLQFSYDLFYTIHIISLFSWKNKNSQLNLLPMCGFNSIEANTNYTNFNGTP